MQEWIEVMDTHLTNQPLIWEGKGRSLKQVPDPEKPPTEAYLFCFKCKRTKNGVTRRSHLETITVWTPSELPERIEGFVTSDGVVLINDPDSSVEYIRSGVEPDVIRAG